MPEITQEELDNLRYRADMSEKFVNKLYETLEKLLNEVGEFHDETYITGESM